jgi:hypothetical protein
MEDRRPIAKLRVVSESRTIAILDPPSSSPHFNALTTPRQFHTFHWQLYPDLSGRNSAVECQLPKLDVAGSTPVARSKIL